jgi:sugar-phosphatase
MRLDTGTELRARALLFDMDGTLIDSRRAVEEVWQAWCARYGVDWDYVKPRLHGVRLRDSVRRFAPPGLDLEAVTEDLYRTELVKTDGIVPIPGAPELLASLPAERWTIVTSADRELAEVRLRAAGLAVPPRMVSGEEVVNGKPDPQGYIEGARRQGCAPQDTLVFEDALAGIQAGRAAGARVLALATDHEHDMPEDVDWIPDLRALRYAGEDADGLRLVVVA